MSWPGWAAAPRLFSLSIAVGISPQLLPAVVSSSLAAGSRQLARRKVLVHAVGGNPLDVALWDSPAADPQRAALARHRRLATLPFDHERRLVSVLTDTTAATA